MTPPHHSQKERARLIEQERKKLLMADPDWHKYSGWPPSAPPEEVVPTPPTAPVARKAKKASEPDGGAE